MIVKSHEADRYAAAPPKGLAVALVYGPDAGLVQERAEKLLKSVVPDLTDPFNVADLSEPTLLADPARLADEAAAISMMGGRRVVRVRIAGEHRWAVVEDVARLRDALGVPLPPGVAEAHAEPVADPLGDLVSRYARTHGPFRAIDLATHLGIGVAVVSEALRRLGAAGRVVEGEFLPGGIALEWCDSEVLRLLRRRRR